MTAIQCQPGDDTLLPADWVLHEISCAVAARPGAPVSIDTETGPGGMSDNGLEPWRGSVIRGVSIGVGDLTWYLPVTHDRTDNLPRQAVIDLLTDLGASDRLWVWANGKYDWSMIEADFGVSPRRWARHWDVLVGCWLEDENRKPNGLKEQGAFIFGAGAKQAQVEMKALCAGLTLKDLEDEYYYGPDGRQEGVKRPMGITRAEANVLARTDPRHGKREMWELTGPEMEPYARQDAKLTLDLYEYQRTHLDGPDIARAMPREMEVARCVFEMERIGVAVDERRAQQEHARAVRKRAQLEEAFDAIGVNPASYPQMAKLVYETWGFPCIRTTEAGKPSTDRAALEEMGDHPKITAILEWRRLQKAITAYYEPWITAIGPDGRLHPNFKQTGTVSGRFACEKPNLMQIPREDTIAEVRALLVPGPEWELWELDLSQAELRIAAAVSGETALIEAFAAGRDVYQEVADQLGCSRSTAKQIALSYQYGAGASKIAAILTKGTGKAVTPADINRTTRLVYQFQGSYPRLSWWTKHMAQIARDEGRIPLPVPGRFRHFRGRGYLTQDYKDAFNSECQGSVAELMKSIMVAGKPVFAEIGSRLLLQIHDSLVVETPPGSGPILEQKLQEVVDDHNPFPVVRQRLKATQWVSPARPTT